jgi:hypothetical protein
MGRDGKGRDGVRWDGLGRDGGWDGMGWDWGGRFSGRDGESGWGSLFHNDETRLACFDVLLQRACPPSE